MKIYKIAKYNGESYDVELLTGDTLVSKYGDLNFPLSKGYAVEMYNTLLELSKSPAFEDWSDGEFLDVVFELADYGISCFTESELRQ